MRSEIVVEKRQKLQFIGSCTNYPTVVTVKQEFVKMEPTCDFFRNLRSAARGVRHSCVALTPSGLYRTRIDISFDGVDNSER